MTGLGLGTYTRKTPCKNCGGTVFRHGSLACVDCQRKHNRKHREKRKKTAVVDDTPKVSKPSKKKERNADRTAISNFLSGKF